MDIAVVTGASSGLGLAISRRLLDLGFRVYGLGGNYSESTVANVDFRPMPCDLADPTHVEARIKEILEKEGAITVLVNNAKYYPPEDFAQGAPAEFARSLNINLLCPVVLVRWCLEGLRRTRGCVINISAATPETSRGGPIGACAAGGLRWMQESLFQQLREDGVAVSAIYPEPNRWRPEDAPPPNGERPQSAIDPQAVADALMAIVNHGRSNVITEVVIRPERLVERTIPPVRELPYPKPKPIPYTVPREQIEREEREEREAEEREMGLAESKEADNGGTRKKRRRGRGRGRDRERGDDKPNQTEEADAPSEDTGEAETRPERAEVASDSRRHRDDRRPESQQRDNRQDPSAESGDRESRRSRSRGRGRRRGRKDERHPSEPRENGDVSRSPKPEPRGDVRPAKKAEPTPSTEKHADERPSWLEPRLLPTAERPAREELTEKQEKPRQDQRDEPRGGDTSEAGRSRSRRRRGRKPRPAGVGGEPQLRVEPRPGPLPLTPVEPPVAKREVPPAPAPKPVVEPRAKAPAETAKVSPEVEEKPVSVKKSARKATKTAAKKAVTKKAAIKKTAVKKAAAKKTVTKKVARKRVAKQTSSEPSPASDT